MDMPPFTPGLPSGWQMLKMMSRPAEARARTRRLNRSAASPAEIPLRPDDPQQPPEHCSPPLLDRTQLTPRADSGRKTSPAAPGGAARTLGREARWDPSGGLLCAPLAAALRRLVAARHRLPRHSAGVGGAYSAGSELDGVAARAAGDVVAPPGLESGVRSRRRISGARYRQPSAGTPGETPGQVLGRAIAAMRARKLERQKLKGGGKAEA